MNFHIHGAAVPSFLPVAMCAFLDKQLNHSIACTQIDAANASFLFTKRTRLEDTSGSIGLGRNEFIEILVYTILTILLSL
jgi:hypothetical protein